MSAGEAACRKFQVSGAVQGVFFRASARECARRLGLSGWIRNLADGRVEALASGTPEALDEFARWLARGPDRARVTGVASETSHEAPSPGFEIR